MGQSFNALPLKESTGLMSTVPSILQVITLCIFINCQFVVLCAHYKFTILEGS